MRPEPGQAPLDDAIRRSTVEERVAWVAAKRDLGFRLAWEQVDAAGITGPVEQASFLLERLYPDMPRVWFDNVIDRLRELHAAGRWHGFERP